MKSSLLRHEIYDIPENDYRAYRQLWMRVCAASQVENQWSYVAFTEMMEHLP